MYLPLVLLGDTTSKEVGCKSMNGGLRGRDKCDKWVGLVVVASSDMYT